MPQRPARSANPYSGMTDDELLAKVQQIRSMAASEAESSVTGRSYQGPALDRFPEAIPQHRAPAANVPQPPPVSQQPYVQAEMLTNEARPPVPATGWRGIGESVLRGLASTGHPGGYHGYAADQQQVERQRQQDLLSRAQQLRGEGMARDRMNIEADRFSSQQDFQNRQLQQQRDLASRPQFKEFGTAGGGYRYGAVDPSTAEFRQQGEIPGTPAKPENLTNLSRATVLYRGQPTDVLEDLDPSSPSKGKVFLRTAQGLQDVTGQTQHYQAPAASIQMANQQAESVPEWVQLITTGQADLTDAPFAIRSQIVQEAAKGGNAIVPTRIRERIGDLESARNVLVPIKDLVAKIKRGENVVQNSLLLENYTRSVGTVLARQVGQERGVATDQDVARAVGLVPGWKSSNFAPQYADEAMALLEDVINRQDTALKQGYFQQVRRPGSGNSAVDTTDTTNTGQGLIKPGGALERLIRGGSGNAVQPR